MFSHLSSSLAGSLRLRSLDLSTHLTSHAAVIPCLRSPGFRGLLRQISPRQRRDQRFSPLRSYAIAFFPPSTGATLRRISGCRTTFWRTLKVRRLPLPVLLFLRIVPLAAVMHPSLTLATYHSVYPPSQGTRRSMYLTTSSPSFPESHLAGPRLSLSHSRRSARMTRRGNDGFA